jgi:hypothetical protein
MTQSLKFSAKVYSTSDQKKLKSGDKVYVYGTLSIRDARLTPLVGQTVIVRVYKGEATP